MLKTKLDSIYVIKDRIPRVYPWIHKHGFSIETIGFVQDYLHMVMVIPPKRTLNFSENQSLSTITLLIQIVSRSGVVFSDISERLVGHTSEKPSVLLFYYYRLEGKGGLFFLPSVKHSQPSGSSTAGEQHDQIQAH